MAGERKQRQTGEEVGGCLGNILEVVRRRKILLLNLLIGPFSLEKLWMDIWVGYIGLSEMGRGVGGKDRRGLMSPALSRPGWTYFTSKIYFWFCKIVFLYF